MAGDRGTSFPVAGLAVVALFLSTLFLAPRGYDFLRQSENDAGKQVQQSQPSVEARLWEDPFEALRRHRDKLAEHCKSSAAGAGNAALRCEEGQPGDAPTFREKFKDDSLTVIAAILPGATFVGSEEARRRSRYALLSGLDAAGYVPDNSERMSLLRVQRCDSFSACKSRPASSDNGGTRQIASVDGTTQVPPAVTPSPPAIEIVYETLSTTPAADAAKRKRAVVLWLDDSLLGRNWLVTLTVLLKELSPARTDVRLRVLGPASSEGLVSALDDLTDLAAKAQTDEGRTEAFRENWNVLARLRLISPNATTADRELLMAAKPFTNRSAKDLPAAAAPAACSPAAQSISVEEAFRQRLDDIHRTLLEKDKGSDRLATPRMFFVRTVGTDERLIDRLVDELFGRGLDPRAAGASRRVALIGEWDSIYARTFAASLQTELLCRGKEKGLKIDLLSYQYLRGLDGVTIQGAQEANARGGDNLRASSSPLASLTRSGDRNAPPVEWAEGRNQRDYLRRLVDLRLGQNDWRHPESEIQAIGIIGYDVHDKLMIAQALRGTFQDRVVFTTDLDARLLHPVVNQYTRNLIVASSLPLTLADDLQCGVPPFRDSYQTSMFLAGRYAVTGMRTEGDDDGGATGGCASLNAVDLERRIREAISNPYLFEISRDGIVELAAANELPRTTAAQREGEARSTYAVLAGAVLVMLGFIMVLGMPGPAMQTAVGSWSSAPGGASPGRSTIIIALLQAAALGFAAAVVVELGSPGSVGPFGALVVAAVAGAGFCAFFYPGTRWVQNFRAGAPNGRRWDLLMLQVVIFLAAAVASWMVLVAPYAATNDMHEPFAPFSGASAWPSQLLRTLSIVLFAWFLDHAWCRTEREADAIETAYFPPEVHAPTATDESWFQRTFVICRNATIWLWQPRSLPAGPGRAVDGAALWREYRNGLLDWPRLARATLWIILLIGVMVLVACLVGGARPEIPARGIADRTLFLITLDLSIFGVVCLLVVVADATVLTWRFIVLLKRGRTIYPTKTVKRFAAELGEKDLQALAAKRIAAHPVDRGRTGGHNTLLDDWIEARLLGEQTAAIGPLIIYPFILVALMIVARSRLFDNWQVSTNILVMFTGFVLCALALAALLNYGAEMARRVAVERMQADLLWLKGAGPEYAPLVQQFPSLIDQVRNLRQGAYAPFFEQPLVKALLVPLGGAGGIQLLDLILFGS